MSAIKPGGEKIVENLQEAVEALQRDVNRVELWAGALGSFAKPIPEYGHGQTRFDLPVADDKQEQQQPSQKHDNGQERCGTRSSNGASLFSKSGRPPRDD